MDNFFKTMGMEQKIAHFERLKTNIKKKQEELEALANEFNADLFKCWGVNANDPINVISIVKLMKEVIDATQASRIIRPA